jgi:hypothetical protein
MLSAGLLIVIVSSGKEGVRVGALSCPPTISVPGRGLCSKKVGKTFFPVWETNEVKYSLYLSL